MPRAEQQSERSRPSALGPLLCALFLLPRIALLFARQPFFDELYTRWIGAKPFAGIVEALHHDSGPPLYYFLVHALGDPSIAVLRVISLLFAFGAFLLVMKRSHWAAALLALYPPAVLLSVDARAYAMCAFFVAFGILALEVDRPFAAALSFVAGAYCHYYGVLFFPLLALRGRRGVAAAALAGALFAPGFLLAMHQPTGSMGWVDGGMPMWLSFAGRYGGLLFEPPDLLIGVSLALLCVAVGRSVRFAAYVLVPLVIVSLFMLSGRYIYFPLRFESIVAVPLVLWLADSLEQWPRAMRIGLATSLMAIGAFVVTLGAIDHKQRPLEPCTTAAQFIRARVPPGTPVVASEYCYLVALAELGPRVTAFPSYQAEHPGWWRPMGREEEGSEIARLPRGEFVWLGHASTPEMAALVRHRRVVNAVPLDPATRLLRFGADTLH